MGQITSRTSDHIGSDRITVTRPNPTRPDPWDFEHLLARPDEAREVFRGDRDGVQGRGAEFFDRS